MSSYGEVMDLKLVYQPEHHFRFFDFPDEPKKIIRAHHDYEQLPSVTLEEAIEPLLDFHPHVKEMVKLVKEKCQQPKDNLSIDESASIMLYTVEWLPKEESFYYILNRKLSSDNPEELKPWYSYLKLFSTSLSKLPRSSHRIFYRAIQLHFQKQYYLYQTFLWNSYSSCHSSIEFFNKEKSYFAETENRTLFVIHTEHGRDISQHSFYSIEHEILLAPERQFQVVSYRKSTNGLCLIILKDQPVPAILIENNDSNAFDLLFRKRMKKYGKYSEINFRNQNLTDHQMELIVKYAIQKKKCHWLSLQNNRITSYGLSILANGLKGNESLESLHLSHNFVNDFGVHCLTKILSNNYSFLTFLSLNYNCIQDQGAQYLAKMLKINRVLTDLWLSYNEIGNDGVQSLAEVLTFDNSTLSQLYLHGNKLINDRSLHSLVVMLQSNRQLDTIWLHDCNFTETGRKKFVKTVEYRGDVNLCA